MTFFAVPDCAKAMDFYRNALGAEEVFRFDAEDRTITHAEMWLGDCLFQLSEPFPSYGLVGPPAEGNSFTITYWTDDVDAVFNRLVAGAAAAM